MDEIIKTIAEAEERAEQRKKEAEEQAARVASEAQARVFEIRKQSEEDCKALRARILSEANAQAKADYEEAIRTRKAEAVSYADEALKKSKTIVNQITGRVCGDS